MGIIITVNANSTGASTLNINGLGAKPIKKANGNDVTNLRVNGVYTLRYNASTENFILQGEGGSGNAQEYEVLKGKTFTNDEGEKTGSIIFHGANGDPVQIITPGKTDVYVPKGYYSGNQYSGVIKGDADIIPSNIKKGVNIFGVTGNLPTYGTVTGGDYILVNSPKEVPITSYMTVEFGHKLKEARINLDGVVRVYFTMAANQAISGAVLAKIYVNDVAVSEAFSASNGSDLFPIAFTIDINVKTGDLVQIYGYTKKNGWTATLYNFKIGVAQTSPFAVMTVE